VSEAVIQPGGEPAADPVAAKPTVRVLRQAFAGAVLEVSDYRGDLALRIPREALLEVARLCRDHPELDYCYLMDIATADYQDRDPRFEVVYNLYSLRHRHRVRLHVGVPEDDPVVDSLVGIWPAADWFEREGWDLMGIRFRGHPRLVRILTHPEFVGHALRKDYHSAERHRLSRTYDLFTEPEAGAAPADAG
jgi:NADH/F420H2 dehydrogenase subunit C